MGRPFAILLLAAALGCGRDRFAPMGAAAPVFGSTPALSTVQGFAVGTWRQSGDPHDGSAGPHFANAIDAIDPSVLTLAPDGRATLVCVKHPECVGHGIWSVLGDRIAVSFADVDGLSFAQVDALLDQRRDENREVRRTLAPLPGRRRYIPEGEPLYESVVAASCRNFPQLAVSSNGKHLDEVFDDSTTSSNPNVERAVWLRVK